MNDLELIRSFRSDIEPPDAERIAAARARLCAECAQAAPAGGRRRPRPLRRGSHRRLALVGAPVLAAVAALLLAGGLGGGPSDEAGAAIIHHADAALALPPHMILHAKVEGDGFVAEWWQLTSPPFSYVGDKGRAGAASPEQAADATTSSYFDPATNTIHETPSATPPQFGDPLAQIRQELAAGRARSLGSAVLDGVPVYKIQFEDKDGYGPQSLVVYVNQQTYRPILLDDPQRDGTVVHLRVTALEYLPATPANTPLLSLTSRHPAARVVTDPGSAKTAPISK